MMMVMTMPNLLSSDRDYGYGVLAMTPNPAESYPAITYMTDDGGNQYKRQVKGVLARLVENEDDPTEETLQGFTIVYSRETEKYEYAALDQTTGDLKGSGVPVIKGIMPPAGQVPKKHLRRTAAGRALVAKTVPPDEAARRTITILSHASRRLAHIDEYETWNAQVEDLHRHRSLQTATQLKTLVVPIKFADHKWRGVLTKGQLTRLFNNDFANRNLAPSGSVKQVFSALSHGKLEFTADVMDWIQLSKTESFYAAGKRGYDSTYMHQALTEALNYLENTVKLDFSQYDADGDGLIDSILFVHSGYAAEFGGVSEDGAYFMDRIWSHTWNLPQNGWTSATHGVRVQSYPLVSVLHETHPILKQSATRDKIVRVGVIAHELATFLALDAGNNSAAPNDSSGSWGLLSNGWGFTADQNCVPVIDPFSLMALGWAPAVQTIGRAESGSQISLKPAYESDSTIYKVTDGFPSQEYLLLEYRGRGNTNLMESCLPVDGGLAVWHIDESASAQNKVTLVQADGLQDLELGVNLGDSGDLFHPSGVHSLGPGKSAASKGQEVPYPNTDSYQGYPSGLSLTNIDVDAASGRLTMQVLFDDPTSAPILAPSIARSPTSSPTLSPVITPSPNAKAPTSAPTAFVEAPTEPHVIPRSCPGYRESLFKFELTTDLAGRDLTWELTDAKRGPAMFQSGGPYGNGSSRTIRYGACLDERTCWSFSLKDRAGNGIDLSNKPGTGYKVWWKGEIQDQSKKLADGTSPHFFNTGVDFGSECYGDTGISSRVELSQSGDLKSQGIMFDVHGDKTSIVINKLLLHLADWKEDVTIKVYTKNGSYQGYEKAKDAWTLVLQQTTASGGFGAWTWLNYLANAQALMKGTTQSFYVEVDQPVLYLMDCSEAVIVDGPGDIWQRHVAFDVLSGVITKPAFGGLDTSPDGRPKTACLDATVKFSPLEILPADDSKSEPLSCYHDDERMFSLTLDAPPSRASDLSWIVEDVAKAQHRIAVRAANQPAEHYTYNLCLPVDGCFRFVLRDASGQGASHKATYGGGLVAESDGTAEHAFSVNGGDFGSACSGLSSEGRNTFGFGNSGQSKANGIMFDIQAKSGQQVNVYRPSILVLETGTQKVKIFTKNGSYRGYENDASAWTQVFSKNVVGKGKGRNIWESTNISPKVAVLAETTQAFYFLVESGPNMYYDALASPGALWKSFDTFKAFAGTACTSSIAFTGCKSGPAAGFNGGLMAGFVTIQRTFGPTAAPTASVTPTAAPSVTQPSCSEQERLFQLRLDSPAKASNLSWFIEDVAKANARVFSPVYADANQGMIYRHHYCLPVDGCYRFILRDGSGQGISHRATYDGKLIVAGSSEAFTITGGDFGSACSALSGDGRNTYGFGNSGQSKANGIMFDIQAKAGEHVNVFRPSILILETGTQKVKVFTKNGSYRGYEDDASAWTQVFSKDIVGKGKGGNIWASTNFSPKATVLAQTTQAFYFLVESGPNMYYDALASSGELLHSFDKFNAFSGTACTSSTAFTGCDSGQAAGFNGGLSAGFVSIQKTFPPTAAPTPSCSAKERVFQLRLDAPAKASNLSWTIQDVAKSNASVFSPVYADSIQVLRYRHQYCLPVDGCYMFVLRDASGEGASHYATYDGGLVAESSDAFTVTGGDFGSACSGVDPEGRNHNDFGKTGQSKANGVMFDVQAHPGQQVNVFRFSAFHFETGSHSVKVFTKNGSYRGYESDASAWTEIFSTSVVGNGKGLYKWQGANFAIKAPILAETIQAFYVVLEDGPNMYYTSLASPTGDLWQSFDKFKAFAGRACTSSTAFRGCDDASLVAGYNGIITAGFVPTSG
jgi:M6 family metalloprotease-like protein